MRLDGKFEARLDYRGGDRVMATARAEGRDGAFVVAMSVAQCILRQIRVMEFWFGEIGHCLLSAVMAAKADIQYAAAPAPFMTSPSSASRSACRGGHRSPWR